jgi:hypothetical protein
MLVIAALVVMRNGSAYAAPATCFDDGWCEQVQPATENGDVDANLFRVDMSSKASLIFYCIHGPDLPGPGHTGWAIEIHAMEGTLSRGQISFILTKRDRKVVAPFVTRQMSDVSKMVSTAQTAKDLKSLILSFERDDVLSVSDGGDVSMRFAAIPFLDRFIETGKKCFGESASKN